MFMCGLLVAELLGAAEDAVADGPQMSILVWKGGPQL